MDNMYTRQIEQLRDATPERDRRAMLDLGASVAEALVVANVAKLPNETVLQVLDLTRAQFVHATTKVAA